MEELNESTFSTFDQNPLELIQATLNTDALSADICDGLCDIFDIQSYFPIVSNLNSDHTNININDISNQILAGCQQSLTVAPTCDISALYSIQTSNEQQANYQQNNQQSTTGRPLYSNSASYGIQTSNGQQVTYPQVNPSTTADPVCLNSASTGIKIRIKSHPRQELRARMEKESIKTLHYLLCEQNSADKHPTIYVSDTRRRQSFKNIIEVTLVGVDKQPHCYKIRNKKSVTDFSDENAVIFQNIDDPHSLYFCVTDEDANKGNKSFEIGFIKSKQDEIITKDLIKTRKLDQSILRFTHCYYQSETNILERDESSTEYSCIMKEACVDIAVESVDPGYGPMCGNETVHARTKGPITKKDITVVVSKDDIGWSEQVSFTKDGNFIYFSMPPYPFSQVARAQANVTINYKGDELYQSAYVYIRSLDQELALLNLNDSPAIVNEPSSSNRSSTSSSMEFNSGNQSRKRTRT
ncbi:unnamed protein product [Adineta steineri]|uniref:Uncharacterized protein n=1 Tax=Adineta steineri TaxID=433720 RepID=A0A815HEW8_9BILA|nr:unnamed protein product [Adineta steineri]CAF1353198.1 unnamed protein product [Adineta steineri]CAF3971338.1 unnamed protein product [Adineta steineri]